MEIVIIIAKSAAILTLFYVLYLAILQKDTFFTANRHYLLAGIIAALVIPFIEFTKTVYIEMPMAPTTPFAEGDFIPMLLENTTQDTSFEINWWAIVLTFYSIGVLLLLGRLVMQLVSLYKLLNTYSSSRKGNFTFVEISDNIAPFSFFRTICYNPALHTQEELQMIIAHEKVHARQLHTLDVLLTQIILAFQWVNPLAWFYKKSLEQNLEFLADSGALHSINSPKAYQHTLVKVSSTSLRPALTNQFYHSLIKKRIVMLNKETSHRRNLLKLGLVLPLLGLFMYSFNIKEVIAYKEVAFIEGDTALPLRSPDGRESLKIDFAKAETKKSNVLHATMSDVEINNLKNALENDAQGLKILFTERKRNAKGELTRIMVETKYPSQKSFYKNVTFGEKEDITIPDIYLSIVNGNDLQFSDADQEMIFRTSLEGVKAELFSKEEKAVVPALGENPLYIINGEKVNSQEVKNATLDLDGQVEMIGKKEAIQKYGQDAKDGALEFVGTTTIKEDSPEITKPVSQEEKTAAAIQELRFKIDKNTSDAELNELKAKLDKEYDLDMSYTLRRNEAKEITSIQISYTGNAKNGNYSISGDNPIDEFYFFIDDDGKSGFWSEKQEERMKERQERMSERLEEHKVEREKRAKEMEARREEMTVERAKRLEEMKARREEMRSQMNNRGEEMKENMKARRREMKERFKEQKEKMKEQKEKLEDQEDRGYVTLDNTTYYFANINGETKFYDRFGVAISNDHPLYDRLFKKENGESDENTTTGTAFDFKNFEKDPLVIVDGIEYNKRPLDFDPNQIESVTVLKDKKAKSFYGKKGKNGVVIIVTKE